MNISFQDQFYVTFIMMEKQSCFRAGQVCKIFLSNQAQIHDFRVFIHVMQAHSQVRTVQDIIHISKEELLDCKEVLFGIHYPSITQKYRQSVSIYHTTCYTECKNKKRN